MIDRFMQLFINRGSTVEIHALRNQFSGQTLKHVLESRDLTKRIKQTDVYKLGLAAELLLVKTNN